MSPLLSVVTGTVDRPQSFFRFVESVVRHTTVDWEMLVSDASAEPVTNLGLPERVRVISERPRLGHSKGYNQAFASSLGKYVIWGNDDAEVCPGYDTTAIAFMEAHPRVGLGALHYSEDGEGFRVNSAFGCVYANFGIIRRDLGNRIGWFDETVRMYGADNSLAFRVLLADYGVSDIPGARIIHHSVKDDIRVDNQRHRAADNQALQARYMPLRKEWTAAYLRHKVATGTEPWSHGKRPVLVGQ